MALPVGHWDRGDAFARFYASYSPRVAGLARRFVGDADVADVVQETFLRAYRARLHLEEGDGHWPWLATVARNLCHDLHRARAGRELPLEEGVVVALVPGPDVAAEDRARAASVAEALQGLSPRQRQLLLRRHVDEVPCIVMAAGEGTSVDALKSALARAREAFRARYEGWRGLVPEALASLAARARAVRDAVAWAPASPAPLRSGVAGALTALIALGLSAPQGTASEPTRPEPPIAPRVKPDASAPVAGSAPRFSGGAPVDPPSLPVGGRPISFQPPESPDVPPTPALTGPPAVPPIEAGQLSPPPQPPSVVPSLGGAPPDLGLPEPPGGDELADVSGAVTATVVDLVAGVTGGSLSLL